VKSFPQLTERADGEDPAWAGPRTSRRSVLGGILCLVVVSLVSPALGTARVCAYADPPEPAVDTQSSSVALREDSARYGVDYSKINVDWPVFFRTLRVSGRDFIGRYLPVEGAMWRRVTPAELQAAAEAGVDCFFWFENLNDLYRALDGYAAGAADAREALGALASLGVPTTTPVYYTVDWANDDGSRIDAYFRGIASVVPVSQIGAYGDYTTIGWLDEHSLATYFCQSDYFMDARGWHPQAQIRQETATYSIGGVYVDRLTVTIDQFGQYRRPLPRYQQTDSRLGYLGTWHTVWMNGASAGAYRFTNTAGSGVTVVFNGTFLSWLAKKSPTYGRARVILDGQDRGLVDLYDPATRFGEVWNTGPLAAGTHTVQILWTGEKNDASSDTNVSVDAVDIVGTLR
jgi:hypothetical protein